MPSLGSAIRAAANGWVIHAERTGLHGKVPAHGQVFDMAQATLAVFEAQGHSHPVLGQIVALIESRCALTIRRLTLQPTDADPDPAGTAVD